MSKERLEEINQRILDIKRKSGMPNEVLTWSGWQSILPIFTKDLEYLQEQAERAQELERQNQQLKNNLSVYKGYYKNMIKINEGTVEKNKKYRRLIKNMGQEVEVLTDVMSNADNADELNEEVIRLKGSLKNEVS